MNIVREERYIFVEQGKGANHNKFWNILLFEDGFVETRYGRVGDPEKVWRSKTPVGEKWFDRKVREQVREGYTRQHTVEGTVRMDYDPDLLKKAAQSQIATNNPTTQALLEYLIENNTHQILASTTLSYNKDTGLFSTPLGIVTQNGILQARTLLSQLSGKVAQRQWDEEADALMNQYLRIIPKVLPRTGADSRTLFPGSGAIEEQSQILDSLEASLQVALSAPPGDTEAAPSETPRLFEARLFLVEDGKIYDRIRRYYLSSQDKAHHDTNMRLETIYEINIQAHTLAFEEKGRPIGGVQELWHGTRTGNLLSIMKSGFVVPPSHAAHCTGRAFGNGVYFANCSTKSLNYARGVWGGKYEYRCFMVLADVALGKYYVPRSAYESFPKEGYHSTWAKRGQTASLLNDEIIVYDTAQILPKYLVEFVG